MSKRKMLLCGDFACPTGFAVVCENLGKQFKRNWEVDVLAINYHGDAHPLQKEFNLYPSDLNGDVYGLKRILPLLAANNYDLIFIVNDIWIIDEFVRVLHSQKEIPIPPVVWYTPVDAKHIKEMFVAPLNKTTWGIAYTEFGKQEILKGGLVTPIEVIPHGVDTTDFYFMPQKVARKESGIPEEWFVILNVSRNQPRKRLDLQVYYFAEWVKQTNKPDNVKFYYHGAMRDIGWDIQDLCSYYGVADRLIITSPNMTMANMLPRDKLKLIYNSADIWSTTCASEGWCLPLMEAMACAIPCIVPRSSALAEWPNNNVAYVEIYEDMPFVNTGGVNTIMDTPRLDSYIEQIEKLYTNHAYRKELGKSGWKHVTKDRFKWSTIAKQFEDVFIKAMDRHAAQNKIEIIKG